MTTLVSTAIVNRTIRQVRILLHRQGVEIGAQSHRRTLTRLQIRDQTGFGTVAWCIAVLFEPAANDLLGTMLFETQLGMLMQIVPHLDQARKQGCYLPVQRNYLLGHHGRDPALGHMLSSANIAERHQQRNRHRSTLSAAGTHISRLEQVLEPAADLLAGRAKSIQAI